ncbi:SNF2 superfamily chromatin remodeling protein [Amylostereum chailletii]|nr:SNF2 superfamily chromatin remodeling protein [Amylostereum chailletii]
MSSRLDRLLLLLDTGSSTSVRTTAAKQLAQIAAKSLISDVALQEDIKAHRQHLPLGDPSSWKELMAVVARVLPYLHSRSHETRSATSVALSHVFTLVPLWHPFQDGNLPPESERASTSTRPPPEFPMLSVEELMHKGTLLLASSGKEFIKPTGILSSSTEVKKARKEAMGRLGLDFLDFGGDDDMDLDKELAADVEPDADMETEVSKTEAPSPTADPVAPTPIDTKVAAVKKEPSPINRSKSSTPVAPSPITVAPSAEDDLAGLSARERNRLKRKRKQGNSAFVAAPPPQASSSKYQAAVASSSKARLIASDEKPSTPSRVDTPAAEKVIIDPTKGGAVSPKTAKQSQALEVPPGYWAWDGLVKILEIDIFSPAWEVRHGAAMALRELLKTQGKYGGMKVGVSLDDNDFAHERWCNDLAARLLCVFVLDRFGDFVSDQVVAPVRETVSQTLASLLLHMPRRSVLHVHKVLLHMIRQDFALPVVATSSRRAGKHDNAATHVWEVRHAGLLGIKYEVAVRSDIFEEVVTDGEVKAEACSTVKAEEGRASDAKFEEDVKMEDIEHGVEFSFSGGKQVLQDVVDTAVLGLGDRDDDVRSVAASCLLPVATHLVRQLPGCLSLVLAVLWNCLGDMKDDLSSSVGAVMDLLGKLVSYDEVIAILADPSSSRPLSELAPTLFPFFRHTIPTVRLAVVETLHSFMNVASLPKDWISPPLLRLLFQNLVVEERSDIRHATMAAWRTSLLLLQSVPGWLQASITAEQVLEWSSLMTTPMSVPLDPAYFYNPVASDAVDASAPERHNVDKNMLAQDLTLISPDTIWLARIAAASAFAYLVFLWGPPASGEVVDDMFQSILLHYIDSSSMLQKVITAVITEQWALEFDVSDPSTPPLVTVSGLALELSNRTLAWLQSDPPPAYHEMAMTLAHIHNDCSNLLLSFGWECKIPWEKIPVLPVEIDLAGTKPECFSLATAESAVGELFTKLKESLGRTKRKELASLIEKRKIVVATIDRYKEVKTQHDIRVSAAFAAAFVALKSTPDKVSPIVKGVMNGIKNEENVDLQTRSAVAVAAFIEFCAQHSLSQPPDKIVKNLCTFLCQDVERTPTWAFTQKQLKGIISFAGVAKSNETAIAKDLTKVDALEKSRISRRGAGLAFVQLSSRFGPRLLDVVPKMWQSMAGGLQSACDLESSQKIDKLIEDKFGQDIIDSLSVLEAVIPTLHADLWPQVKDLFPLFGMALRSRFAVIRQCVSRCFAAICDVMTVDAMRFVIDQVLPFLGDVENLANREGAMELVYNVVQKLDHKALPYVIFLVVPILGRMSDPDEDTRSTATNTFATLVKMVPLEAGLPDPPGFSDDLLKRRDEERQFLTQLLDGSKVEQYDIPVVINAELRKYQQDGVNWLAFLAKYQLHGILCDDMGLGKTLQSICILASKHYERAQRYKATKSADSKHLPSLIICPPTLTGHWYYEILKYADNLKPVLYVGNARDRGKLLTKFKNFDVVITSYEVVRNDIASLQGRNWLYCILDEGHVIKNAKTKLTKAVKCICANHRLILSGTPIQNNVLELWSLFDFLMPGFLGSESFFNERFSKPILSNRDGKSKNGEAAALALEALHKQVLPFLLRRLKEDVLHDLPPKIIQDYFCELSDMQKQLYDEFANSQARLNAEDIIKSDGSKGQQQHVFQSLQYLRKLCNHPALVLKTPEAVSTALEKAGQKSNGVNLNDISNAPKLLALRQLLVDCGIGGTPGVNAGDVGKSELADAEPPSSGAFSQHRVLIFCQMKQMLDIIETDLFKRHMPSITYMRLDGGTDANKRHAVVQTFNADPSIDCLLLTTHVGGLGLTLTGADTVIFVEHDWNPMKDLQAMDRAHRIGQKKVVNVYRLITKGTLEEKIMGYAFTSALCTIRLIEGSSLQRFKLNIANSVVTQQNSGLASMDTDLVLDLFRHTSAEEDAANAKKDKDGIIPSSHRNVLQGLEDLPAEEEYQDLEISSFMSSIGR